MCSTQTLTLMFSKYSLRRMAVVVLPLPEGPVSVTTGRSLREDKMVAAAALILSWNASSQRNTNWVSLCMASLMFSISITRIVSLLPCYFFVILSRISCFFF